MLAGKRGLYVAEDNRKRYRHTGYYPLVLDDRPQEASAKDLSEALAEPSYVASSWAFLITTTVSCQLKTASNNQRYHILPA